MVDACPPFDWNITAASINLINNRNNKDAEHSMYTYHCKIILSCRQHYGRDNDQ